MNSGNQNITARNHPKFTREDRKKRKILVPNLSPEYTQIVKMAFALDGLSVEALPLADQEALDLGKRYVHNDICFPAQITVGEIIKGLNSGEYNKEEVAVGMQKNCKACRALQYYALARKGLDEAGYPDIPIVTSGDDPLGIHPGVQITKRFRLKMLQGMVYVDAINDMRQKILPYEKNKGETEKVHAQYLERGVESLHHSWRSTLRTLAKAVESFNKIESDRSNRRPVVGIVGEIFVNYHPGANYNLVEYLFEHGMEPFLPPILEFFRQDSVTFAISAKNRFTRYPLFDYIFSGLAGTIFGHHVLGAEKKLAQFKYYEKRPSIGSMAKEASEIINPAFESGEGWLLSGEILSMIHKGVGYFVIVQPFGCLPNHISGRGTMKPIKEKYPHVQIISLDYDPDISKANIENRLQMLIMSGAHRT